MKKFLQLFLLAVLLVPVFSASAQEMTDLAPMDAAVQMAGLEILSVQPAGPRVVDVTFNENVDLDSVRVTIENQTSKQSVKVKSYEHSEYGKTVVRVILASDLKPSTTYTMIINSVISENNNTIKDGIDAIRDFITPAKFSEEMMDFEAPSNDAAVMVDSTDLSPTDTAVVNVDEVMIDSDVAAANNQNSLVETETEELPSTGVQTTLLVALFAIVALVVLGAARRKNA